MTSLHKNRTRGSQSSQYATSEDFCQALADNLNQLYVLSFLMTGDHELAEGCFVAVLEEGVRSNHVFSEWAGFPAKRTIVQNAIRALQPHLRSNASLADSLTREGRESIRVGDFELYRVLALKDFERFVFVLSVLEGYSDQACALLLGCSLRQVREARMRAITRMEDLGCTDPSNGLPTWRSSRQILAELNTLGD